MKKLTGWTGMALAVAVLTMAACSMPMVEKGDHFEAAVRQYLQKLRWQEYYLASSYMKEDLREDFLSKIKKAEGLNIVNINLKQVEPVAAKDEYQTVAVIEYFIMPSLRVREKELRQTWVIVHPESWKSLPMWQISTPFPEFP